jgi:hypothetical protein
MTPDRFIAAAFIELAYDGTGWNLYVAGEFIQRVEQRAAELARESVGDGWMPIHSAPVGVSIICYHEMLGRFLGFQRYITDGCSDTVWTNWNGDAGIMPPTHWQPFPEPPTNITAWNTRAAGDAQDAARY